MDNPAVLILLLEQGEQSLEDHTTDFVFLSNYTHYPDSCLCSFYLTGLNTSTRAQLSGDGPRESLAAFIEWVLVSCKSELTMDIAENDTSPTRDPEPSHRPPRSAELPEPTADGEPEPAAVVEPSPSGVTELPIVPEPEPQLSDQVREPTVPATVDTAVESAGAMERPAHGATAGGEHKLDLGDLIDFHSDTFILQPTPEVDAWDYIPPNLPLPPPLIDLFPTSTPSSLDSVSLPAHPQLTICGEGSPQVCRSPAPLALSLEDPSTPPSASETQTPPRSGDPAAPPRLPAPSSPPEPVSPPAPPGSLVPPAPPWSVIPLPPPRDYSPLAAPRPFAPLAPLGSSFPPAPPQSSVAPAPPRPSGAPPSPRSPKPPAPPWPSGSSASPWLFGSLSPPRALPPPAPPPLVGPMESATTPPPWLLPPSAPPWATIVAVAWVSIRLLLLLISPWLLPPSTPPWTLMFFRMLFYCSPAPLPPPEPPPSLLSSICYGARTRLPGRGRTVTCLFSPVT